jgi:hypothetical protein
MKDTAKTNGKTNGKSNGNGSGPLLKFNHIRRETLPQTRIDVRALEMIRGYPLYVKEQTDHEPPIGEVLEQCLIHTLSTDEALSHGSHISLGPNYQQNKTTTQHLNKRAPIDLLLLMPSPMLRLS